MIKNLNLPHLLLALITNFYMAGLVIAATPTPDTGNIPRVETQPKQPVVINPDAATPDIENKGNTQYPAALPEASNLKVNINTLKFSGNKNINEAELSALLHEFLGQSLGIKELNKMTTMVTDYYRQHGFMMAQAYLPEQDVHQNTLEIAVIEGYLGELKFKVTGTIDESFLKKIASNGMQKNDAIKESNLVRNVTLINALPGLNASSQLNPGQEVGYSDVDIDVQVLPFFTGFLSANTYGNRYTGREVANAGLFLNNLADRGDQLSLNLKLSNGGGERAVRLGYVVPVNEVGAILNLSTGYLDYRLGGQFSPLGANGDSTYVSALLDWPVLRSRKLNITSRFGGSYKDVSDDISAFSLKGHRAISAAEFGLFGDWRDVSLNGFNQLGLNLKLAEVNFKNGFAEALDAAGANTEGSFIKYNLFASRLQPISADYGIRLMAEYQGGNKNLDSSEKVAIGGINRWRDFGYLPTSSDRGFILGAEFRRAMKPVPSLARFLPALQTVDVSPYVFYDYGKGVINHNALSVNNHVRSSHYGLGVDALLGKKWMFNIAVSHQNSQVSGVASEKETMAWGQLQWEF